MLTKYILNRVHKWLNKVQWSLKNSLLSPSLCDFPSRKVLPLCLFHVVVGFHCGCFSMSRTMDCSLDCQPHSVIDLWKFSILLLNNRKHYSIGWTASKVWDWLEKHVTVRYLDSKLCWVAPGVHLSEAACNRYHVFPSVFWTNSWTPFSATMSNISKFPRAC